MGFLWAHKDTAVPNFLRNTFWNSPKRFWIPPEIFSEICQGIHSEITPGIPTMVSPEIYSQILLGAPSMISQGVLSAILLGDSSGILEFFWDSKRNQSGIPAWTPSVIPSEITSWTLRDSLRNFSRSSGNLLGILSEILLTYSLFLRLPEENSG